MWTVKPLLFLILNWPLICVLFVNGCEMHWSPASPNNLVSLVYHFSFTLVNAILIWTGMVTSSVYAFSCFNLQLITLCYWAQCIFFPFYTTNEEAKSLKQWCNFAFSCDFSCFLMCYKPFELKIDQLACKQIFASLFRNVNKWWIKLQTADLMDQVSCVDSSPSWIPLHHAVFWWINLPQWHWRPYIQSRENSEKWENEVRGK